MASGGWKSCQKTPKSFSASNLSSISNTSSMSPTLIRQKSLTLTLPASHENFGAQVSQDGRVRRLAPNGPAHASALIQVGDYVKVMSWSESPPTVTLRVNYSQIQVHFHPHAPFAIEIGNKSQTALGIALMDSDDNGHGQGSRWTREIRIGSIQRGSLAERCGFLRPGDTITSIQGGEGDTIPCGLYTSFQVAQILRRLTSSTPSVSFTIVPKSHCQLSMSTEFNWEEEVQLESSRRGDVILSFCLWKDSSFDDWGFSIADGNEGDEEEDTKGPAIVHEIRPGGPAFLVGLLPGDKILQINEREVSTFESTILVPILASLDDALNLIILRP